MSYEIVANDDALMVIRDISHLTGGRTITNDAEGVVADLHRHHALGERRLLYYDSDGDLDELKHKGGTFLGFAACR